MKVTLHEQRLSSIIAAIVTIFLGVVMLWWPNLSVQLLCVLLGLVILGIGFAYLAGLIISRKDGVPSFYLIPGVILIALGGWLVTTPDSVTELIQYIFGAILIVHALIDCEGVVMMVRYHRKSWRFQLFFTLITMALGLLILYNPFDENGFSSMVMLIGAALVFDGASDLCLIFHLSMVFRSISSDAPPDEDALEIK